MSLLGSLFQGFISGVLDSSSSSSDSSSSSSGSSSSSSSIDHSFYYNQICPYCGATLYYEGDGLFICEKCYNEIELEYDPENEFNGIPIDEWKMEDCCKYCSEQMNFPFCTDACDEYRGY